MQNDPAWETEIRQEARPVAKFLIVAIFAAAIALLLPVKWAGSGSSSVDVYCQPALAPGFTLDLHVYKAVSSHDDMLPRLQRHGPFEASATSRISLNLHYSVGPDPKTGKTRSSRQDRLRAVFYDASGNEVGRSREFVLKPGRDHVVITPPPAANPQPVE